VRVVVWL